jgi:GNAT superfamily N-acetyltransferase
MEETRVTELTTETEFTEAYPVMEQLRPIPQAEYLDILDRRLEEGYRLFALRKAGQIRALAGLSVETNFDHGTHVWVHDFVVDESHRGQGYGSCLLEWVGDWADERECSCVELASGLWRDRAHEFYEANGMERYCYTFYRSLTATSPY